LKVCTVSSVSDTDIENEVRGGAVRGTLRPGGCIKEQPWYQEPC